MNVSLSSTVLASIVCLTVGITILFRRPRRQLYLYFAGFTVVLFAWHAASFASLVGGASIRDVQTAVGLLIPPTALLFFNELLRHWGRRVARLSGRVALGCSSVLMVVVLSPWGDLLLVRAVAAAYVLGTLLIIAQALWLQIREVNVDTDRKRMRYVLVGLVLATVLGAGELFPDATALATLGHVAVTVFVYFLYQSIVARRLIDMVELVGKGAVLGVLTLVLSGVYALLVLWVGAEHQGLWLFNTLVASFVILILYDQIRPWVENTTANLIFRERYKLREAVPALLRQLRTTLGIDEMAQRVVNTLYTDRTDLTAVYIASDENEVSFDVVNHRGDPPPPATISLSSHPALLRELRRERRPILLEHLHHRLSDEPTLITGDDATSQRNLERTSETIHVMHQLHAAVVVPMLIEERIVGLLAVGTAASAPAFSTDELAALLSVAESCAVVIENSQEFEKRRERDRLVAVGEMAAGVAHEIRNPLGAIKGAAQIIEPETLPAEAQEYLQVILEEVDRLNNVVEQFLRYARPYQGQPVPTDVNDVVSATLRLLDRDQVPAQVDVQRDLAHDLPQISIDPEHLKQVLINLVRNAVQAMPDGGRLLVRTRLAHEHRPDYDGDNESPLQPTYVLIRVEDSGEGIDPADLPRIFVPFYTTKADGTGLGLAISQRIIERAGGRIEVYSRPGYGTAFTLRLPVDGTVSWVAGAERSPSEASAPNPFH